MNGVVFQTSAMMITAIEQNLSPNHALSSAMNGSSLTKPVSGRESELPGEGRDHGDDAVRDQDGGAHHPAPEYRLVHDQRDDHAQRQLEGDRDHRDTVVLKTSCHQRLELRTVP